MIDPWKKDFLEDLIFRKVRANEKKETIFTDLCIENCFNLVDERLVTKWFEQFENGHGILLKHLMSSDHFCLLVQIAMKYPLLSHAIHMENAMYEYSLLSNGSRYRFKYLKGSSFVRMIDTWTGNEIELKSNYKLSYHYTMKNPQLIESNLILFSYTDSLSQKVYINLMSFDVKNETFKYLDSHFIGIFRSYSIFHDQLDIKRFLLINEIRNVRGTIGQVIDDKIILNERILVLPNRTMECKKFVGDTLCGFHIENGDDFMPILFEYQEHERTINNEFTPRQRIEFKIPEDDPLLFTCYVWDDDICYVSTNCNPGFHIYGINVTTHNYSYINIYSGINSVQLCIDKEEDNLVFMTGDAVYQYPLRKPEKMQRLCWFQWRRRQMFNNTNNNLKLPSCSEFQPFYGLS